MKENDGVPAQAHKLLGQRTEIPRKYDSALTRTLRSCKYTTNWKKQNQTLICIQSANLKL